MNEQIKKAIPFSADDIRLDDILEWAGYIKVINRILNEITFHETRDDSETSAMEIYGETMFKILRQYAEAIQKHYDKPITKPLSDGNSMFEDILEWAVNIEAISGILESIALYDADDPPDPVVFRILVDYAVAIQSKLEENRNLFDYVEKNKIFIELIQSGPGKDSATLKAV